MEQITLRVPADMLESIDSEAAEHDRDRSEHIREVLRTRNEVDELREEVDELRRENERLHREKRQILEQREETKELARYVEDELSWRQQGIITRMKWWLTGKPGE